MAALQENSQEFYIPVGASCHFLAFYATDINAFFFFFYSLVYILKIAVVFLWDDLFYLFFFSSGYFHYKWDLNDTDESRQVQINHKSWLE